MDQLFGSGKQTTKTSPWGPQQGYLKDAFAQAQNLFQNYTPQYYQGSTVAGTNPTENLALSGIQNAAANDPTSGAATGYFSNLLSGDYLNSNPYQDATANSVLSKVIPAVSAQFVNSNNMHNPAAAYTVAQGATSALAPIEYQNYQDTLGKMNQGLALAPQTQNLQFGDSNQLLNAGQFEQGQSQNQLSDLVNRWNFQQNLPYQQLQQYLSSVGGNYGSTTTQQQTGGQLSQLLGAGMGFAQAFPQTTAGIGTAISNGASNLMAALPFLGL